MSSSNKQQRRKEDGELSNDEEERQQTNSSTAAPLRDRGRRDDRKRSEERHNNNNKSNRRDEKDGKSNRHRHSSRSPSNHRSNATQSKSYRDRSREKKRENSRERRRESSRERRRESSRERRRDSRERRRDSRSNSKRRSRRSPEKSRRRDSRSPKRGDNEKKRDDTRRRSRSPNKKGSSPTSKHNNASHRSDSQNKDKKNRSPKQLNDAELRELEEANDRKQYDFDSDSGEQKTSSRTSAAANQSKNGRNATVTASSSNNKSKTTSNSNRTRRSNSREEPSKSSKTSTNPSQNAEKNSSSNANNKKPEAESTTTANQVKNKSYDAETLLLMGEMEEVVDSEEEREKQKQELLEMIKGIKGKSEKPTIPQPIIEAENEIIEEEEIGFDNDLINPDDAMDDEDNDGAAGDDYKGENDAAIKAALSTSAAPKKPMNYLKNLEELRNRETKGDLEIEEEEQQSVLQETANGAKSEGGRQSFSEWKETNRMHALDEKEDSESEADMFGDDIEKFIDGSKKGGADAGNNGVKIVNAECDDDQQYFKIRIGEILVGKYRIVEKCGKGVFANVCKAEQLDNGKLVAIKILRSNDIMHESGQREKEIVQKLNLSDKNDKKHIVRLKNVFEHQKHICLVFECFAMNLREALKQYAKGKGFSLDIVRSYAFQMFIAMTHLKKNRLIHADLKPDNLLISEDTKTLKMCDFGTALSVEENGIIKYIQSRYYRAPEVLLGYPPYTQIDVWSIGVTLYEIYTQKYLFDGNSNNEMIKLIMDARGKFNKKMLQSGTFVDEYFDSNHVFQYIQVDPSTKQKYVTPIKYGDIPKNDLSKLLQANKEGVQFENQKKLAQFKDFLDKCLQLDPKNRLTPEDALRHPFLDTSVKVKQ